MLDIFLQILSVVGILLLVIIGLLLVVVLLVLFFPVTYRVSGKKTVDELTVKAKADWLFGLLRMRYTYPEPGKMRVKLLWFTIYESGEEAAKDEKTEENKAGEEKAGKKMAENTASADTEPSAEQKDTLKEEKDKPDTAKEEQEHPNNMDGSWISQKFKKIQYTIRSIYDKIKEIWQNISYYKELFRDSETKLLLSHVILRLRKVVKSLRPRKLKAEILFGTGAPDTTGYVYGIYAMLMPMFGPSVLVTPDFQRAVFEGDFQASGFTTLVVLIWQVLRVVMDKRLKQFMDKLKPKNSVNGNNNHKF